MTFALCSHHLPDTPSICPILICTFARCSLHLTGIGKCKGGWSITIGHRQLKGWSMKNGHKFPDSPSICPILKCKGGLLPTGIGKCKGGNCKGGLDNIKGRINELGPRVARLSYEILRGWNLKGYFLVKNFYIKDNFEVLIFVFFLESLKS